MNGLSSWAWSLGSLTIAVAAFNGTGCGVDGRTVRDAPNDGSAPDATAPYGPDWIAEHCTALCPDPVRLYLPLDVPAVEVPTLSIEVCIADVCLNSDLRAFTDIALLEPGMGTSFTFPDLSAPGPHANVIIWPDGGSGFVLEVDWSRVGAVPPQGGDRARVVLTDPSGSVVASLDEALEYIESQLCGMTCYQAVIGSPPALP